MGYWLVIDLEATTEEGGWPLEEMEIIEIGATLVASDGHEHSHFKSFVKPQRRPFLTDFCRELTHISQHDIDTAAPFEQVWQHFELWLKQTNLPLAGWCSWGDYDQRQLSQQWRQQQLESSLLNTPHLNLKNAFRAARKLPRAVGLKTALSLAGLHFQGQQHRALEDARNTARLLPLILPSKG